MRELALQVLSHEDAHVLRGRLVEWRVDLTLLDDDAWLVHISNLLVDADSNLTLQSFVGFAGVLPVRREIRCVFDSCGPRGARGRHDGRLTAAPRGAARWTFYGHARAGPLSQYTSIKHS